MRPKLTSFSSFLVQSHVPFAEFALFRAPPCPQASHRPEIYQTSCPTLPFQRPSQQFVLPDSLVQSRPKWENNGCSNPVGPKRNPRKPTGWKHPEGTSGLVGSRTQRLPRQNHAKYGLCAALSFVDPWLNFARERGDSLRSQRLVGARSELARSALTPNSEQGTFARMRTLFATLVCVAGAALSQGQVQISCQTQHFRKVRWGIRGRRSTFAVSRVVGCRGSAFTRSRKKD